MKIKIYASAFTLSIVSSIAPASAETIEEVCTETAASEGSDAAGCACLQEQVEGQPELEAELISVRSEDGPEARYNALSDEGKAAIEACF